MELTEELKATYIATANTLSGSDRRLFMARIVKALGKGGAVRAEVQLGWHRETIRKGIHEFESGIRCVDNFAARGRKPAEYHRPHLLEDIKAIVDPQSQTDPTFSTNNLYTRISAKEVRRQLIEKKGYTDSELPTEETIRVKLNKLGYRLKSVVKSRAKKKSQKPTRFLTS